MNSDPDGVGKQRVAPLIQRAHEIGFGMDRAAFALLPFAPVGFERKMLYVIVAGLFPVFDRERLPVVLTIELGQHALHATGLAAMLRAKEHFRAAAPEHQDFPKLRTEEAAEIQQLPL